MASFTEHKKILKQIEAFKPQLNKIVDAAGVMAVNHFTKSFRDGGFTDESLETWKPRKRAERGKSRAVLVKSGRLRRSLRSRRLGNLAVKIMTDVPYARVHNNGERSGRGKGFKMPKRQFIGYSGKLNRQIIAFIDKNIKKQFNK
jgi:phage gpG-like protein